MAFLLNSQMLGFDDGDLAAASHLLTVPPAEARPMLWHYEDVYAVPGFNGLYDSAGRFIENSSILYTTSDRVDPLSLAKIRRETDKFSPPQIDLQKFRRRFGNDLQDIDTVLFLGNYGSHFGHWLIDYMSRLWAYPSGRTTVLMPPIRGQEDARTQSHIAPIFDHIGLGGDRIARLATLTRLEHVAVPEPAFQTRFKIYRIADHHHMDFARRSVAECASSTIGRKIYLSRSRLARGIRRIVGEDIAEAWFNARGYESIHPETLSLADQALIFNRAEVIAGFEGSAFHSGMFSLPGYTGSLVMLCGNDPINTRLILQNSLKAYRACFVNCFRYRDDERRVGDVAIDLDLDRLEQFYSTLGL